MNVKEYTIKDLEKESLVEIRNIRYYTAEKLLLPPEYRGRDAVYTEDHLKRLKLIARLKGQFTLEGIRTILNQMNETEIDKLLQYQDDFQKQIKAVDRPQQLISRSAPAKKALVKKEVANPQDTVAYIDYLLGRSPEPKAEAPSNLEAPPPLAFLSNSQIELQHGGESWERIPLAMGVELHVHQPVSLDDEEPIKELVRTARNLFRKRKKGG